MDVVNNMSGKETINTGQSVFWIEVEKIKPNPYQPRREFDPVQMDNIADSIRQYGVLQPLVATRREFVKDDGGLGVEYELIAGERRLRAAKIAGVQQVPVMIRTSEQSDREKLEIAIIENIQREDLNVVERAKAFQQLADKFNFKHHEIAKKVGKSREYVTNSMRVLLLPPEILDALSERKINEGHTRPLLMLATRPDEQMTLFKEILLKKLPVRDTESIARKIASDRARIKDVRTDPEIINLEKELTEKLGTRVSIEKKDFGGRVKIDFFSTADLRNLLELISTGKVPSVFSDGLAQTGETPAMDSQRPDFAEDSSGSEESSKPDIENDFDGEDLYSISNFSI